jgi:hypothetical protein
MLDLDDVAPNYRRAQQRWPDASTLARAYEALDERYVGNGHGLVEHVKSFIETVCMTIMEELNEPMPSETPSTTDLLVAALGRLGLRNTRGANKLDKVLSGFNRLADALTEMRNETGPVAHGKDAFLDAIATDHARAFLHTGDAILAVLLNAFEGKQPDLFTTREPYESFRHLNERIDGAVSVAARIDDDNDRPIVVFAIGIGPRGEEIELRAEASRLLYGIDREAYIEVLRTASLAAAPGEAGEEEIGAEEAVAETGEAVAPVAATAERPVTDLVPTYVGVLSDLRTGVAQFLLAEGSDPNVEGIDGTRLIDSLLATSEQNLGLDWKERAPIRARVKVASKRVLVQFGVAPDDAEVIAERFVSWLRVSVPDAGVPETTLPVDAGDSGL